MPFQSPPPPAYFPTTSDSPLYPPVQLYHRLSSLPPTSLSKTLDLAIPPRSGRAFPVPAGSLFRFSTPEGPQVGDLNIWNRHDPRERFWAKRTSQLQGSHLIEGDRLWSCLPWMRPLAGVVRDGCQGDLRAQGRERGEEEGGPRDGRGAVVSSCGGRMHDLLGTRCDPYGMCQNQKGDPAVTRSHASGPVLTYSSLHGPDRHPVRLPLPFESYPCDPPLPPYRI